MADVVEVTVLEDGTSEVIERDYTPQEAAQRAADVEAARIADMEAEADRQAAKQARATLLDRLGITEAEAAILTQAL